MKTILLTGPIGSGKSEAGRILQSKGFPVYVSDDRTKTLYNTVPGLKARIESILELPYERWKEVFSSKELLSKLEAMVYPFVRQDFDLWRSQQTSGVVFMESAVALSKPLFKDLFDEVWVVDAPLEKRIFRNPSASVRDCFQGFDGILPAVTIHNDGTLDELKQQIENILWKKQI